jgi:hypothetical protein
MGELKQLLFMSHNSTKVSEVTFDEFAYLLGSETAVSLPMRGAIA